ncbi:MAG: transposase [Myxococcota bacterium]|nr:transposase [Myxococcota bacterium]
MAKPRKRHQQQQLFGPKGGIPRARPVARKKRRRLGRKPNGPRAGSPHKTRPEISANYPVHIVLRVVPAVGSLRKRLMYAALRQATITVALRAELRAETEGAFRIVHISIQRTHVHLLVEADNKLALSRGMQSFQISAAKHLNHAASIKIIKQGGTRRRGTVFPDRYYQEVIRTPTQARHALAYVLNNWRKHREDEANLEARRWKVDPFSTGALFAGWQERVGEPLLWKTPWTYQPLVVYLPSTWLLKKGWLRGGGPFSVHDVPGQRPVPRPA